MQVRIGDLVSFDAPPVAMVAETALRKSLDNRAGVAALVICAAELAAVATGLIFISWPVFRKRLVYAVPSPLLTAWYRTWRWPSMLLTERLPAGPPRCF